jgi:hypothetical protein
MTAPAASVRRRRPGREAGEEELEVEVPDPWMRARGALASGRRRDGGGAGARRGRATARQAGRGPGAAGARRTGRVDSRIDKAGAAVEAGRRKSSVGRGAGAAGARQAGRRRGGGGAGGVGGFVNEWIRRLGREKGERKENKREK